MKPDDHQKFEALLNELGLSRAELAEILSMSYTSVTNQLAPAKKLPRWAIAMLCVQEYLEKKDRNG